MNKNKADLTEALNELRGIGTTVALFTSLFEKPVQSAVGTIANDAAQDVLWTLARHIDRVTDEIRELTET